MNISTRESEEIGEEERGENMRLEREGKWALQALAPPTRHGTWEGIRHGRRLITRGEREGGRIFYSGPAEPECYIVCSIVLLLLKPGCRR